MGIGGGLAPEVVRQRAARSFVARSLGDIEDELYKHGYELDPNIEQVRPGAYRATAWGGESGRFRAQALGSTPIAAAQSLVRCITRR